MHSSSRSRPHSEADAMRFDGMKRRPDKVSMLKIQNEEQKRNISRNNYDEPLTREEYHSLRQGMLS